MGLGFFIARTLLERTGGALSVGPAAPEAGRRGNKGARVAVRWSRQSLEASPEALAETSQDAH